jgi:dTDP-4-dehydrorhamnose 3,5-epimerase
MALTSELTAIPGVIVFTPPVFKDSRGFFMELFHARRYGESGLRRPFVQDNLSRSCRGTLRGLHYQLHHPQSKLVSVLRGEIFDVAVDIRRGSPTFGRWVGEVLSDGNRRQLLVPEGFAHGFCVLSEEADVFYKCTDFYVPEDDRGVLWSDPATAIAWPVDQPIISERDRGHRPLSATPEDLLPRYESAPLS